MLISVKREDPPAAPCNHGQVFTIPTVHTIPTYTIQTVPAACACANCRPAAAGPTYVTVTAAPAPGAAAPAPVNNTNPLFNDTAPDLYYI